MQILERLIIKYWKTSNNNFQQKPFEHKTGDIQTIPTYTYVLRTMGNGAAVAQCRQMRV